MKKLSVALAAFASSLCIAQAVQANNVNIEDALKGRPELSSFYQALANNGVLAELKEYQPYTVFAPTNDAMAQITQKFPCFNTPACHEQTAQILRRHIVPGEKHLRDTDSKGGIYSMFSIDHQHVIGAQDTKDSFTVNGNKVISENQLLGGELYKINGVLADDKDLAMMQTPIVIVDQPENLTQRPAKVVLYSTSDATTPIPH